MVVRLGRFGRFLSCSKFPECKGMKSLDPGLESLDLEKYHKPDKCPKCGKEMILKSGKYGMFWACVDYPGTCKGVMPLLLNERCPECDSLLVERKGKWGKTFIGCSGYPDCKYIKKK
jgi:DNA topoisomerase-1